MESRDELPSILETGIPSPQYLKSLATDSPADVELNKAQNKGRALLQALRPDYGSRSNVEQQITLGSSPFMSSDLLLEYGYAVRPSPDQRNKFIAMRQILRDLEVSHEPVEDGGNNMHIYHEHEIETTSQDGKNVEPNGAYFMQFCNPVDGVLIAESNMSACTAAMVKDVPWRLVYPALQHWSDIAYLQYLTAHESFAARLKTPKPVTPLRYILRLNVQNWATIDVLLKITKRLGEAHFPSWPGWCFHTGDPHLEMIMGTPSGAGIAYLLGQHQIVWGRRWVSRVFVFHTPTPGELYTWPSLLFCVDGENNEHTTRSDCNQGPAD